MFLPKNSLWQNALEKSELQTIKLNTNNEKQTSKPRSNCLLPSL
jgi:hypothetical protein